MVDLPVRLEGTVAWTQGEVDKKSEKSVLLTFALNRSVTCASSWLALRLSSESTGYWAAIGRSKGDFFAHSCCSG